MQNPLSVPFVRRLESFGPLSEADRQVLDQALARVRAVDNNEDLALEGDRPDEVLVMLSGFACAYKILPSSGERQILAYLLPGDICGLQAFVLGAMDHSVSALCAGLVASLPRELIERLAQDHPGLSLALWRAALLDEVILREWLIGFGCRTSPQRIAHLLCEILARLQAVGLAGDNSFDFPVTQTELGETVGLTVVHVNRIVQRLRKDGLITLKGRRLTIHDPDRLKKLARFRPAYLRPDPAPKTLPIPREHTRWMVEVARASAQSSRGALS